MYQSVRTIKYVFLLPLIFAVHLLPVNAQEHSTHFWHVGAVVHDMEGMHKFYTEVLGLENVTDLAFADEQSVTAREGVTPLHGLDELMNMQGTRTVIRHYSAPNHDMFLEFIYFPDHPSNIVDRSVYKPRGWSHLGLQVKSIDTVIEKINKTKTGSIVGKPTVLKEFNNNRYLMIKDPEGNVVELFEPPQSESKQ